MQINASENPKDLFLFVYFSLFEKNLGVWVQLRFKDKLISYSVKQESQSLLLYTDTVPDSAAVWLLRRQPLAACRGRWFFKGHLVAQLRMTAIRQERLSRAPRAIGFAEFLTLAACQERQHS